MYKYAPHLAVIFAALLWSVDALLRQSLYALPALLIITIEHGVGTLIFIPFLKKYWNDIKGLLQSGWISILWISIISVVIFQGFKFDSINYEGTETTPNQKYSELNAWNANIEQSFKEKNQAYLINFTAAWCITCQANDKIALSRPRIKEYMKNNDIEYIVADWTNKNTDILSALEKYNRNGVPLYIFWKPGMNESLILPAILTEQILLDSFENDII